MLVPVESSTLDVGVLDPIEDLKNPCPEVSVVLPCLNEADSVGLCVREALEAMEGADIDGEVLVVDNGSTDGSGEIAKAAGARVISEPRPGYGRALRTGIEGSRGAVIVMADADWSYDFGKLPSLIGPVRDGDADLVLGTRLDGASGKTMPRLHRYIGTPLLTFLVRRAAGGVRVTDSQTGYRAFRKEVALALGLASTGMEFASDMLIRYGRAGLRIREVSTGYRPRVGKSKLNAIDDGLRHLRVISLLAPQLVLLTPGALAFGVGLVLSILGLVSPSGVTVGSLRWQPIFFSTIALTLGLQAFLLGMMLAHQSSLVSSETRMRFRLVGTRKFPMTCIAIGAAALVSGLGLDGALFLRWLVAGNAPGSGFALASAAQSLLIMGGSLISFGLLVRWLYWGQQSRLTPRS